MDQYVILNFSDRNIIYKMSYKSNL